METSIEDILQGLSEEEKQSVLQILSQIEEQNDSSFLDSIVDADFKETPVDVETFIKDTTYLGNAWIKSDGSLGIYPYWVNTLKKLFPDPYTTNYNTLILSGARGIGKSEVAVTAIQYMMYRVLCMKDPLGYYGLKKTDIIAFALLNITKALAEDIAISKFQNAILKSPWFRKLGRLTTFKGTEYWEPPAPIKLIIGSQPSNVVGLPIYVAMLDEVSFQRNQDIDKQKQKALDLLQTCLGGMKTRFIKNGKNPTLAILCSSKRSEQSFLETFMKQKAENDGDATLTIDEPVWVIKPHGTYSDRFFNVGLGNKFLPSLVIPDEEDVQSYIDKGYSIIKVPDSFRADFLQDMDRALCDFAGISSTELNKYISGDAVMDVTYEDMLNPFTKEIIEVGNGPDDTLQYYDFFDLNKVSPQLKSRPLFIHMDMSVSGDMTGIAGVWITGKKVATSEDQTRDLKYQLAFAFSVKAPKGRQVSFEKNRNFIYWVKQQGFALKGVSSDTYQSYDTGQALLQRGIDYKQISVDRVDTNSHICLPYQHFKSVLYEKRIKMFRQNTLIEEIVNLERNINTGKVDHPTGFRKDACDAVCGALFNASSHAELVAYEYGDDLDVTGSVSNSFNAEEAKKQITVDFESEIQKMFGNTNIQTQPFQNNNLDMSNFYASQGFLIL